MYADIADRSDGNECRQFVVLELDGYGIGGEPEDHIDRIPVGVATINNRVHIGVHETK